MMRVLGKGLLQLKPKQPPLDVWLYTRGAKNPPPRELTTPHPGKPQAGASET